MSLSCIYGQISDEDGLKVLKTANELGCTFWDTAALYGLGHNERLIGRFLRENPAAREKLFIASKCALEVVLPAELLEFELRQTFSSIRALGNARVSRTRLSIFNDLSTSLQRGWVALQTYTISIDVTQTPLWKRVSGPWPKSKQRASVVSLAFLSRVQKL